MPIAVPTGDKTGPGAPAATRGLKGLFSRNKVVSPEPIEPMRSRFRSLVDDVTARGQPGTRKDRTTQDGLGRLDTRRDDDRTPRSTVRPRPTTPNMTAKRTARVGIALPPVMQKGHDGRWQPPSLSKGSMSTSALAQLCDDHDDKTAKPLEARKGGPALHALFRGGGVDKDLAARMERIPAAAGTSKLSEIEQVDSPASKTKTGWESAKALPVAPAKTIRAPQTPIKAAPPSAMISPANRSTSRSSIDRPGSRHTSRIQVSQPSSPTQAHLSLQHYHLRLATSFLLKQLTPVLKGSHSASKESNADMRRLADDRLAILGRIERNWGPDWIRAAAQVKEAGDDGVPDGQVRMANVGERAKERERKAFLDGMRDGILLCLYLNITFPAQPSHILQISMTDDGITKATNLGRFISACQAVSLPADATFTLADFKDGGAEAVGRIARTIVFLARLAGRQRPKSPAMSRSPVRTGSRPPSRGIATLAPGSPPGMSRIEVTSTPMGSPSRAVAPLRPISPTRSSPPQSRMMERTRSADSANDLQTKLQASTVITSPPAQPATPRTPTTPTRNASGSASPRESPLLPRQSLIRSQTQPNVSPTVRPRASRSPTPTSGSTTPTHSRRPSLRPRNTAPSTATRVSFAEQQGSASRDEITGLPPILHVKERTPSLVSGTTDYTRSSAAYSALTVLGDIPDDAAVAVDLSSDISPAGTAAKRDRSRRNSEKTLHEARQRFIGSFAAPADLAAAFRPLDDTESELRAEAFSQSLAALEGSSPAGRASPVKLTPKSRTSSSESERPRVIEEEDGKRPTGRPLPGRRTSGGKFYLPKRSISPTQLGPSPDPSPTMPGFVVMGPPAMSPTSRNSGRTSVDLTRQPSRVDRRPSDRSNVYRPAFAASAIDMSRTPSDQSRIDSRARVNSMSPGGPVSRRNSDRSMWSRPASIVVLDFPGPDDEPVRYHLGSIIGRGQFGIVHKALNMSTGQMVAIKRISLEGMDDKQIHDVTHEVELLKSLSHPSIVRYEGMKRDEETLAIVLEYIENGSLGSLIKDFGNPSEKLVASYTSKILEGLDYLHGQGVIHRDLKAANILSTKNGNIKLSDFGVSLNTRAVENIQQEVMTASMNGSKPNLSDVVGTPNWMAPEIIEMSGASFASDIWSLGCTIVELLTGAPPYANIGNSLAVMYKIVQDTEPPIPNGVSDTLDHFLRLCFEKEPRSRPSAAKLFEHPWLRANCPELALLRGQDSVPFLRRVSIETSRTGLHQLFPERSAGVKSRPVSFAGSTSTKTDDGSLDRKRTNLLATHGSTVSVAAKSHVLIKTTFAKPITCRICHKPAKSGVLCESCGLLCHAYCVDSEVTPCDPVEQAARSARQRELSVSTAANSTTSVNALPDSGETTKAWKRPKAALERRVSDLLRRPGDNSSKGSAASAASGLPLASQGEEPVLAQARDARDGQDTVRPVARNPPAPTAGGSSDLADIPNKHEKGKDSKSDCLIM